MKCLILLLLSISSYADTGSTSVSVSVGSGMSGNGSAGSPLVTASVPTSALAVAPVSSASGNSLIGTLTSGSTFFSFIPDNAITLKRVTHTVVVAGITGSGDSVTCNGPTGGGITSTTSAAAALGTVGTGTGTVNISGGTTVSCHLDSAAGTRPIVNAVVQWIPQ